MSTGIETTEIVEPWLYGVLSGDAQLMDMVDHRLINASSDETTEAGWDAYLEFSFVSSRDIRGAGLHRVQVDSIYLVKAVVKGGSYDPATAIMSRATRLLETPETVSTPGGDITCTRETITQYPELQDGTQYRHLGGSFRIRANSSS